MEVRVRTVTYPDFPGAGFNNNEGFRFKDAFVAELAEKFPHWEGLQAALCRQDEYMVWSYLRTYQQNLTQFTIQDILDASRETGGFSLLVARAKASEELRSYIESLEERHYPENIVKRKYKYMMASFCGA